jgi:hypothetical protein
MVYIDRAWIARINVERSSLNIYFPDAIVFLFANINPYSTIILLIYYQFVDYIYKRYLVSYPFTINCTCFG